MKELDFLPQTYRDAVRRRRQTRRNLYYGLALAFALVGLHVSNASRIRSAEATLTALLFDGGTWESARGQVMALEARKALLQRRAALINELEDDAPLDAIIGEIAPLLSESILRESGIDAKCFNLAVAGNNLGDNLLLEYESMKNGADLVIVSLHYKLFSRRGTLKRPVLRPEFLYYLRDHPRFQALIKRYEGS